MVSSNMNETAFMNKQESKVQIFALQSCSMLLYTVTAHIHI